MFNSPLVADRVQTVRASLGRLRGLAAADRGAFRGSPDDYAIAEHHLRRAIQALLDIGRHIVVRGGWGNPAHYREIVSFLERHGVLSTELGEKGRSLAGYRNRLVHEYATVDPDEMWDILQSRLDDIADFLKALALYVGSEAALPED